MIRSKILATMGPAVADVDTLCQLFVAGVDVCRLNFSHGTLEGHGQMLSRIREASAKCQKHVAVLGDLCGPKIRLGQIDETTADHGLAVVPGDELIIQRDEILGAGNRVSTNYPRLVYDVNVGDRLLIEDGLLRFFCTGKTPDSIICQCKVGGVLKSRKGINLPDTRINLPSITEFDWEAANWAMNNQLDFLALSFVRNAADLQQLKNHLTNCDSDIHLIAKIEKAEALADIENIIAVADGLMIARGDLGVEMDVAKVPIIQKDLIRRCRASGKPVIVATQMLQSMVESASPTRAEVSDVANAIYDGTDAVMLSGETSVGKFPVGCVHMMGHIAQVTEDYLINNPVDVERQGHAILDLANYPLSGAIARGVRQIADDLRCKLVVVYSQTGETARIFSKQRFPVPVVTLSTNDSVLRKLKLHYGLQPVNMAPPRDFLDLVQRVDQRLIKDGLVATGERIIVVAGSSMGMPGTMNGIVIHTVGQVEDLMGLEEAVKLNERKKNKAKA